MPTPSDIRIIQLSRYTQGLQTGFRQSVTLHRGLTRTGLRVRFAGEFIRCGAAEGRAAYAAHGGDPATPEEAITAISTQRMRLLGLGPLRWPVGLLAGLVVVLGARIWNHDVVFTRTPLFGLLGALMRRHHLIEVHQFRHTHSNPISRRIIRWLSHRRSNVGVIAMAQVIKDEMVEYGVNRDAVTVLPSAPSKLEWVPPAEARRQLGWDADAPYVVYTGQLLDAAADGKGVALLLDVARLLPDVRFVLVGGGTDHVARYMAEVASAGLANIELTGRLEQRLVELHQCAASVLISTVSSAYYVSPVKVFEYIHAKRPLLAPDTELMRAVLDDEVHALLYDAADPGAVAARIERILGDEALGRRLAEAASERWGEWDNFARAQRIKEVLERWREARS